MSGKPRVFISYARRDGEAFATQLRQRLETDEPEITVWQDRARMEGGRDWWGQITQALETAQFLVLVMTPAAMHSEMMRKEWRYARQHGVCVYPVKGVDDSLLDFAALPRWMRKAHFFDLEHEWQTFVNHLKGPCHATRVPFMAPDLPHCFVGRTTLLHGLLGMVLDEKRENPIPTTIALRGAGGLGKTTLAAALCHHQDVITAFDDGILWVSLGTEPNVQDELSTIYAALTGERPNFINEKDASIHVAEKLQDLDCLVVIDDAWDLAHVRPFLQGGSECTRVITTRSLGVAAEFDRVIVDTMTPTESVDLLISRLEPRPVDLLPFRVLASQLGEWPLMVELAAGVLQERLVRGDSLDGATAYLELALRRKGAVAFDKRDPSDKNQAIAKSIEISLDLTTADERARFQELAIFPPSTDVPIAVVSALWRFDEFETEELVQRLDDLSLLTLRLPSRTMAMHDLVRDYLIAQLDEAEDLHARLVESWDDPHQLQSAYAWRWIGYHLIGAGLHGRLRKLLFDFEWVRAKLEVMGAPALIAEYDWLPDDPDLRLVQGALRRSAHVVSRDHTQLAGQLLGRLLGAGSPEVRSMVEQAREWRGAPWLRPLAPTLTLPTASQSSTEGGHASSVNAVVATPDGKRVISGSNDRSVRVWDVVTGAQIRALEGHSDLVRGVALTPDGRYVVSGSNDRSLRVWDLETGRLVRIIEGHTGGVNAVAVTPDAMQAVSASSDSSVKVWNLESGKEIRTLRGHTASVRAMALTPDGKRVISASSDRTVRLWDLESATLVHTFEGHRHWVNAVAVTPDGKRAISGGLDGSLMVWNLATQRQLGVLNGHSSAISAIAVTAGGKHVISGSWDGALKIWELETSEELCTLLGHSAPVAAAWVTTDDDHVLSGSWDGVVKVWSLATRMQVRTLKSEASVVNVVTLTPDGAVAVSGFSDRTIRVWDLDREQVRFLLEGHADAVTALAVIAGERRLLTGAWDGELRLWSLETGEALSTVGTVDSAINALAVTPDGVRAVSGSLDGALQAWELKTCTRVSTVKGHHGSVAAMALAAGGRRVVSGSWDGSLAIWDPETADSLRILYEGPTSVTAVTVSPDGKYAICGTLDGSVRTWDLETGEAVCAFEGHSHWVYALSVTPDGKRVLSGSLDGTVQLWDLEREQLFAQFVVDSGVLTCGASDGGATFVVVEVAGHIHRLQAVLA